MNRTLLSIVALILGALAQLATAQPTSTSNYQQLRELEQWVGRWDVKGETMDGQPYVAEHVWRWGLGKNYLLGTFIQQQDSRSKVIAKTVICWDVVQEEITGYEFWDDSQGTFTVRDGRVIKGDGMFHHGDPYSFEGELTWHDDHAHSYEATIKRGDKVEGVWKIRLKRRDKKTPPAEPIPAAAIKAMGHRVGKWTSEMWVNNGLKQPGASAEVRWAADQSCITLDGSFLEDGVKLHCAGLIGWDPVAQKLIEHWYVSDGRYMSYRYARGPSDKIWKGTFIWHHADGTASQGSCTLTIQDKDSWRYDGVGTVDGEKITWKAISHRQ